MKSMLCHQLDEPVNPRAAFRVALRMEANRDAVRLAVSPEDGPERICRSLYLIETLEACKTVGDWLYRDVLACVRDTMGRESKS